jgi:hypothetical protein
MTLFASTWRTVLTGLVAALLAVFFVPLAHAEPSASPGCPYSSARANGADSGAHRVSVPGGAESVQLCRFYGDAGEVSLAPNRLLVNPRSIASLTRSISRSRQPGSVPSRCTRPVGNWVDLYFNYPDGDLAAVRVVLDGCRLALGDKGARARVSPQLVERLVSLTSG